MIETSVCPLHPAISMTVQFFLLNFSPPGTVRTLENHDRANLRHLRHR